MASSKARAATAKPAPTPASKIRPQKEAKLPEVTILNTSLFACFQRLAKRELLFHSLFLGLGCATLIAFGFFFSFLADSFLLGIFIACFFFALVLYFVLRLYFQEQKPSQYQQLRDEYLAPYQNSPQELFEMAMATSAKLDNCEVGFYQLPKQIEGLRPYFERMWRACHWKDVHLFKELFLKKCLELKIQAVKQQPSDPVAHAELATCYMEMAKHCKAPIQTIKPAMATRRKLQEQYLAYSNLAIEELEIVAEYAPKDDFENGSQAVWVHSKLAEILLSLGKYDLAIEQYESLLQLQPDDQAALLQLGTLYFKQGKNGKGLKAHEKLVNLDPEKAKLLIGAYGSV